LTPSEESSQASGAAGSAKREAAPIAHEAVHDRVVELLEKRPRGKLLDVPAGEGALALRLRGAGFDVHCCDLYPEIFRAPGIEVKRGDLSAKLPYEDAAFDYVTCLEGLEHIENPHQAVREFRRVLKPGGHLVVSTPNILNIEERVKWLLFGYTSHFKPISAEHLRMRHAERGAMEEIVLHINPISYAELRYILEKYGFELRDVLRDKRKSRIWLYAPLTWLVRGVGAFTSSAKRQERWTDELQGDAVLLGGNTLIVHAVMK
jgi:ubiquinone/menaquinone biosynthesis C-methylase UbiE